MPFEEEGKNILITGGTGSFARVFIDTVLKKYPKINKLIIFSRDEHKQYQMQQLEQFNPQKNPKLRYFIGCVRNKQRLEMAFNDVDIVIHSAALKQINTAEYNPSEYVATNIYGSQNIIEAAISQGVKKVVALSTDKSVESSSLYGSTKHCMERLFIASNSYVGSAETKFSLVRYGNVINSQSSVLPFFYKIVKETLPGQDIVFPITSKEMTRFFISLDEAVNLVIVALEKMQGGEIFIPKIKSAKIIDIAKSIAPNYKEKIIGIRPGEKMHEKLISKEESRTTVELPGYYLVQPTHHWWIEKINLDPDAVSLPKDFEYCSETSLNFSEKELKEMVKNVQNDSLC